MVVQVRAWSHGTKHQQIVQEGFALLICAAHGLSAGNPQKGSWVGMVVLKGLPCTSGIFVNYFMAKRAPDEFQTERRVFEEVLPFYNAVSAARTFYFLAASDITRSNPHLCYKMPRLGNT